MSLDFYFFDFFFPFYPDFQACHPLLHSFFSAHFLCKKKKKQVDVQSPSGVCLFVCLVFVFVDLRFGASWPIFTKLGVDEI